MEFIESLTELQLLKKKFKKTGKIINIPIYSIYTFLFLHLGANYLNSQNCQETINTDYLKVCTRLYRCLNQR